MASVEKLINRSGYIEQLTGKNTLIPNHRTNILGKLEPVTETTIESYFETSTGEYFITFRYPNGQTICARMRDPDSLDIIDEGSWSVVLSGYS